MLCRSSQLLVRRSFQARWTPIFYRMISVGVRDDQYTYSSFDQVNTYDPESELRYKQLAHTLEICKTKDIKQ